MVILNKKIYPVVITVVLFLASACSGDEDEKKIPLQVTAVNLVDIGQIRPFKPLFEAASVNNDTVKCMVRTSLIKKNDSVKSIAAFMQGNNLDINIISYPFDFDCADVSCFTAHDLSFNLTGIKKGTYKVCISVNYTATNRFHYSIQ